MYKTVLKIAASPEPCHGEEETEQVQASPRQVENVWLWPGQRNIVGRTAIIKRRHKTTEDTLALVEVENKQNMELSIVKNILSQPRLDDDVLPTSSSDEEQDEMRNPLFPSL